MTPLAAALAPHTISHDVLSTRYRPVLELVRGLLGVVPTCDSYLEIWPPAFRTYNIMVPNLLNMPLSFFGLSRTPASLVGLGMVVASRTAECRYCTAHACSFTVRRGGTPEKVAQAPLGGDRVHTPAELATIAVARALARVPCEIGEDERGALLAALSPARAEWVVAGISMMGFLNKFMDGVGVPLEREVLAEADAPPRADSWWSKLRMLPYMPGALRLDRRWQRGVPSAPAELATFLEALSGCDFPVLKGLRHRRVARAIGAMLRENLDASTTTIGLPLKMVAGAIYTAAVGDIALAAHLRTMATRLGVDPVELDEAATFAQGGPLPTRGSDPHRRAVLELARAASSSPAHVGPEVVQACREGGLTAAGIVEVVCWLAVLQLLHRLMGFYGDGPTAA